MSQALNSDSKITQTTELETPENVRLSFRLAGPGSRLGAYWVDLVIRSLFLWAVGTVISLVLIPVNVEGLSMGVYAVAAFVIEWGYFCLFETWWNGQTPGKRAFSLRVIKTEGYSIGFYESMLRNLLRAADFFPVGYAAGLVATMSTDKMQRIGDLVAGTMVVRERQSFLRGELSALAEFEPLPIESFAPSFRPTEKTLDVIEGLFRRREWLSGARVDEIAEVLTDSLTREVRDVEVKRFARSEPSEFLFSLLRTYRPPTELTDGPATDGIPRAS